MELQPGKEAASIHLAWAPSGRPFDSQLVLRSDGSLNILSDRHLHITPGWQSCLWLDHGGRVIHADGRRFAVPDSAAGIAFHQRAHGHVAFLEGPDWFWWHDTQRAWAITPRNEGHQIWWVHPDGTWNEYHLVNFPWHATVGDGHLLTWRDDVDQHGNPWGSIHTRHPHTIIHPLAAWLKRQFTPAPKENPVTKALNIDLATAEITIGDHPARSISPGVTSWVQHTLDGRDLIIGTRGHTDIVAHHIDTEEEALILRGIVNGLAGGKATFTWLESMMAQLALHGWTCASWRRERKITAPIPTSDVEPPGPTYPHWTLGADTTGHDRFTIDAATLRDLVDQAAQYQKAIHGKIVYLDGRPYRLVDIPALRDRLHDAITPAVDAARDELTDKAR